MKRKERSPCAAGTGTNGAPSRHSDSESTNKRIYLTNNPPPPALPSSSVTHPPPDEPMSAANGTSMHPCQPVRPPSSRPLMKIASNIDDAMQEPKVIDLTGSSPDPSSKKQAQAQAQARGWGRTCDDEFPGSNRRSIGFNPTLGSVPIQLKGPPVLQLDKDAVYRKIWPRLSEALSGILDKGQQPKLEAWYRDVRELCKLGFANELTEKLTAELNARKDTLKAQVLSDPNDGPQEVMFKVINVWEMWKVHIESIRQIFTFLDRVHISRAGNQSVYDLGLNMFGSTIFDNDSLKDKFILGVCEFITHDRDDAFVQERITYLKVVSFVNSLHDYTKLFEPRMLELSQSFYATWADKTFAKTDFLGYINQSTAFIKREKKRCEDFRMELKTTGAMVSMMENLLVKRHLSKLITKEIVSKLLDEKDMKTLEKLYDFLEICRGGYELKQPLGNWVVEEGLKIVSDTSNPEEIAIVLLQLKIKIDEIVRVCFNSDPILGDAVRDGFVFSINKPFHSASTSSSKNSLVAEMIAKHVDKLLRGGAKSVSKELITLPQTEAVVRAKLTSEMLDKEELTSQLDHTIDLFRCLRGKDVFAAFYKKDLARRLLMGRSVSAEAESSMLDKFRTECGRGYTHNFDTMFRDMEVGRDEMKNYKACVGGRDKSKIDININVLSISAWPTYPEVPVIVPAIIQTELDAFETFYISKHSARKLKWMHALGHCQLRANFAAGQKEFILSAFQGIVLLLFNSVEPGNLLSYESIRQGAGLSEGEVKRTLQSLACAAVRPLIKHPRGREINNTDGFSVNEHFAHEKYRLKINQVQLKETIDENRETHERIIQDRHFETQAAIVRLMKTKKTMSHGDLVSEVIKATSSRGVMDLAEIKFDIERLIEKEYIEREQDSNSYKYVA